MYCAKLILECRHKMRAASYPEIGYKTYGNCGKISVDIALFLSQVGFTLAYVFFVKENCHRVLSQMTGGRVDISANTFAFWCFVLFTLLCLVRKIAVFASTHTFADCMIVLMMISVVVYGSKEIKQNDRILVSEVAFINTQTYSDAIGFSVYCFEGIGVIMPV